MATTVDGNHDAAKDLALELVRLRADLGSLQPREGNPVPARMLAQRPISGVDQAFATILD